MKYIQTIYICIVEVFADAPRRINRRARCPLGTPPWSPLPFQEMHESCAQKCEGNSLSQMENQYASELNHIFNGYIEVLLPGIFGALSPIWLQENGFR